MKVAQSTKRLVAELKVEATDPIQQLRIIRVRIGEHSGTKTLLRQLDKALDNLAEWQKARI